MDRLHRHVAKRIDDLRRGKKLSVNRLADFAGVSRGYMSKLITAQKSPTLRMLARIAAALDTNVAALVTSEQDAKLPASPSG